LATINVWFLRADEWGLLAFISGLVLSYIAQLFLIKDQVHRLSVRLFNSSEVERNYLARELHDGINQRLAALRLRINMLDAETLNMQVVRLDHELQLTLEEADRLVHNLRPLRLENSGLADALRQEAYSIGETLGIQFELHLDEGKLANDLERHLLRISQECIQNAIKHANATYVTIVLEIRRHELILEIKNDGKTLSQEQKNQSTQSQERDKKRRFGGFGRISIDERVSLMKGTLLYTSQPKGATHVRVTVPLER